MNIFHRLNSSLLLSCKLVFLAVHSFFYTFYVFRSPFLKTFMGLDDSHYGTMMALSAIMSTVGMSTWSPLADRLGKHRLITMILAVLAVLTFEMFGLARNFVGQGVRFTLGLVVIIFYSFFICALVPMTDYLVLKGLKRQAKGDVDSKDLYSRQRLFGTLSYGLTSIFVGKMIDMFDYYVLFYIMPISCGMALIVLLLFAEGDGVGRESPVKVVEERDEDDKPIMMQEANSPQEQKDENKTLENESRPKVRKPIVALLLNPQYLFMLFAVFLTGCARSIMTIFLPDYLTYNFEFEGTKVGLSTFFGIALEILILFFGKWFLGFFGFHWLIVLGQVAGAVRCWAYVFTPAKPSNVGIVYAIELLKGVAFAFTQMAGIKSAVLIAPAGMEATAIAVYTAVYSQVPTVITSFAGGWIKQILGPDEGPAVLFLGTAIGSSLGAALMTVKYIFDGSVTCFGCTPLRRKMGPTVTVSQ